MKPIRFLFFIILFVTTSNYSFATEKVSLQLQWLHQFQFAGYYAALENGYYREAGFDVEIRPGGANVRHFDDVSEGRATYGVGSSGLLLSYLRGKPLVALAAIFQHSPDILLSKKSAGINHPVDLIGKRVMMLEGEGNAVFRTMLANEGISLDKINIIPSSFNIDDLVSDKVDVFNSYTSNEPFYLLSKGFEVSKINPINYGVDYYGDCLYTSRSELENNPDQVKKFREASLKGWRYALDHKEEIIALILEKYTKNKTPAHMRFEAHAIEELVMPKFIGIGHMNPGRWQFMASTYEKLDIIKPGYSLDDFIYDPTPPKYPGWLKFGAYITASMILTAAVIVLVLIRFNKKLRKVVDDRTRELSEVNRDLIAQIDENQKSTEELQLNELRLQTLQELNSMTGATEKELTHFAMEAAVRLTRSTIGYIAFINEDETVLTMYAWSKQAMKECAIMDKPIEYSVDTTGLWGEAVRQRQAIITNNYDAPNPYKKGTPDGHVSLIRHMNTPIFDGTRIVIVAGVGNKPTDYEDDDVRQLTLFMSELWTILHRRRVEEALKESEKKYRKLIGNISDVIVIMDKEGTNIYKSPSLKGQFGWNPDELIGKSGFSTAHPDDIEFLKNEFTRLVSRKKLKTRVEYRYLCKDKSYKPVELTAVNLLDDPLINGILANYKDISERKRSEEVLRQSEEKYRTMIERSNDMIWTLDIEGNLTFFNEQTKKVTGLKSEQWLGKSFISLILKEDLPMINGVFQKSINGEAVSYELRFRKDDGEILTISVNTAPIKINGSVSGIVSFGRDITEQRMLERQVQHTRKMESIGTLAGGIAHDFNNILSGIFGYSQLAQTHIEDSEKAVNYIEHVRKGAQRATELVQQILTFSRQTEYQKRPYKIYLEIKEALKLLRSTIPSNIEIITDFDSTATVLADPTKIHQVIMNLCTNAYHAMRKTGGILSVSLTDSEINYPKQIGTRKIPIGKYVRLKIKDTGHGMDKRTLDNAFEPYFTTKKMGQGTGLGLALVQAIIDEHDGFLEVHSELNKGTVFRIYFPGVTEEIVHEAKKERISPEVLMGDQTIMIVDDEKSIRNILYDFLTDKGYHVFPFKDGVEALDAFKAEPQKFDLILTDMTMPGITGDKLAAEILKIEPEKPIILCTGFSENISEEVAKNMGIKKFLEKPVSNHEILASIRNIFD